MREPVGVGITTITSSLSSLRIFARARDVLITDELVRAICACLVQHDNASRALARFARVCHGTYEPAGDALWAHMQSLVPLALRAPNGKLRVANPDRSRIELTRVGSDASVYSTESPTPASASSSSESGPGGGGPRMYPSPSAELASLVSLSSAFD